MGWTGRATGAAFNMKLYRNNRNGTFTDVTRRAGLDTELYGMGVAVGDYNNDGFPDIFVTCVGQNRLFKIPVMELLWTSRMRVAWPVGRVSVLRRFGSILIATVCSTSSCATM